MRRVSLLLILAACGGGGSDAPDAATFDAHAIDAGPDANPLMPQTLAETGLCLDASCTQIAADAHEYAPEYALWSDGATKRRWIYLPPGTQIDTSNMDYWDFPEGTRVWKEFTRDGVRVETRLIQKTGPDITDWYYASFAWNADQDATTLADPTAGVEDALGTPHDIPTRTECRQCHDRTPGRILSFSAILLDIQNDTALLTLEDAIAMDWLSDPPNCLGNECFPLPGTSVDHAALGYLHVNCSNCHNQTSPVINQVPVEWRLEVADLGAVTTTDSYVTAVGVAPTLNNVPTATSIIEPQNPGASSAYLRMNSLDELIMMPKIGHEEIDTDGVAALAAWIDSL